MFEKRIKLAKANRTTWERKNATGGLSEYHRLMVHDGSSRKSMRFRLPRIPVVSRASHTIFRALRIRCIAARGAPRNSPSTRNLCFVKYRYSLWNFCKTEFRTFYLEIDSAMFKTSMRIVCLRSCESLGR